MDSITNLAKDYIVEIFDKNCFKMNNKCFLNCRNNYESDKNVIIAFLDKYSQSDTSSLEKNIADAIELYKEKLPLFFEYKPNNFYAASCVVGV